MSWLCYIKHDWELVESLEGFPEKLLKTAETEHPQPVVACGVNVGSERGHRREWRYDWRREGSFNDGRILAKKCVPRVCLRCGLVDDRLTKWYERKNRILKKRKEKKSKAVRRKDRAQAIFNGFPLAREKGNLSESKEGGALSALDTGQLSMTDG